jgi:putative tricarboxylic transport membrane protein
MVPLAVSAGLLFFSFLFLIEARKRTDAHLERHLRAEDASTHLGTVLWVLVVLVVYAVVIGPVGYLVATAAMFAVVSRALGSRRWVLNVGVGIALSAAAYFGFTLLLGVRLPAGFLEMVL